MDSPKTNARDSDDLKKIVPFHGTKLQEGTCFRNKYNIEKKLGSGGMGSVYQATDSQSQREVAIKQILVRGVADVPQVTERLKREYYFLNAISHPNLVKAHDFFEEKEEFFLVLEFVSGLTMKEILDAQTRRLSLAEQIAIGNQICRAVEALNTAGILHRDIKPANIMLDMEKGMAKVLDLGLGKSLTKRMASLTQDGSIVGTAEYMSPEQVDGTVSGKSDIFSLGITLYQFFLWERTSPFHSHSSVDTMVNVVSKELPTLITQIKESCGLHEKKAYQALSEILEQSLIKDPEKRLASAGLLADRLEQIYRFLFETMTKWHVSSKSGGHSAEEKSWRLTTSLNAEQREQIKKISDSYDATHHSMETTRIRPKRIHAPKSASSFARISKIAAITVGILIVLCLLVWMGTETDEDKSLKWNTLGEVQYNQKRLSEARRSFTRAIELNPMLSQAYKNRGNLYCLEGKYDKAMGDCNKAIQLDPHFDTAYCIRAVVYERTGDYHNALLNYTQAIGINPRNDSAYNGRGHIYKQQKKYDEALADYGKAIEIKPHNGIVYINRGLIYEQREDYENAIMDYEKCIAINPHFAMAYLNKGWACQKTNQIEMAIRSYKIFLEKAADCDKSLVEDTKRKIRDLELNWNLFQSEASDSAYGLPKDVWKSCSLHIHGYWMLDMTSSYWEKLPAAVQRQYARQYQEGYARTNGLELEKTFSSAGVTFQMMLIPPGRFWTGSPPEEKGRNENEKRERHVLASPFYMSKYEITQEQWQTVMGSNPSFTKGYRLPIENVSRNECQQFCKRTKTGLPTEIQWEYACRSGTLTPFYWGKDLDRSKVNSASYWANEDLWDSEALKLKFMDKEPNRKARTMPGGSFSPNSFGLYDMLGNVWEWCQEEKSDSENKTKSLYIFRGGSWYNEFILLRAAFRGSTESDLRDGRIGFRIILDI